MASWKAAASLAAMILVPSVMVRAQTFPDSIVNTIAIRVHGQYVRFQNAKPERRNGVVLVPLRDVMESIGGAIVWDADNGSMEVSHAGFRAQLTIGSRVVRVGRNTIWMPIPPVNQKGETLVPAEFFAQAFGGVVTQDVKTNVVSIAMPRSTAQVIVTSGSAPDRRSYRRLPGVGTGKVAARAIIDPEYDAFLRDQDFQRYLADRASWIRSYQAYREGYPLTESDLKTNRDTRYMAYLRFQDDVLYDTSQLVWQQNYNRFLRQRTLQTATSQSAKKDDYFRDRASLMQATDRLVQ